MKVPYSYLGDQFGSGEGRDILEAVWKKIVKTGRFTLGPPVEEFEKNFAKSCEVKHAIGMNSGTDALRMILVALGVGSGDEVITVPNSFIATTGAIATVGARPVFVDVNDGYLMDVEKIELAITPRTKAIMPVHLTGNMVDMPRICDIADRHKLFVIEDSAQAVDASILNKKAGTWGIASEFSFHPLKNLNGWGDGGMVTTNNDWLAEDLRLLRNHGLSSRDYCDFFAYNCRLHSIQAAVLNILLEDVVMVSNQRISNALLYNDLLSDVEQIVLPPKKEGVRQVYHTYVAQVERRDELAKFLAKSGIGTKIHYSVPIHLQRAAKYLGYKKGDFPVCEAQVEKIISLPIHQYLQKPQIFFVVQKIKEFYSKN